MRIKHLLISVLIFLSFSTSLAAQDIRPSIDVTNETIRAFVEGRNDAYRHILSFANVRFHDHSVPGMPTSQFFTSKTANEGEAYVSGAIFAFTHLTSLFRREDLVSCYAPFSQAGYGVLRSVHEQDPSLGRRNVIAVLLNFCLSTEELQQVVRKSVLR